MTAKEAAEEKLNGMLAAAGLPVKASYVREQVCAIFGFSERTFYRYVSMHELDPESGAPIEPWTLDSYMTRGHHRVRYDELVSYLERNRTYERKNAVDVRQLDLFPAA
ncbi:MAG: helix-turn-helix domain-containing protein [Desulfuromonadales bacterium]|nr:helix-turn-helix domain-containing protein [Desulfuromonadales bacterium]